MAEFEENKQSKTRTITGESKGSTEEVYTPDQFTEITQPKIEYIGSLGNDAQDISLEIIQERAEDKVVALILSSLMGTIVERWEYLTIDDESIINKKITNIENCNSFLHIKSQLSNTTSIREGLRNVIGTESMSHQTKDKSYEINQSKKSYSSNKESESKHTHTNVDDGFKTLQLKLLFEAQKENIFGWEFLDSNPRIRIFFKQGNKYEGPLFRCRMHGQGKFFWANGCIYEGDFVNGEMTGVGKIEWSDQSWYEGEFLRGFRHGVGLFVGNGQFYAGHWHCGLRHGLGAMFYSSKNTEINYYNGEWSRDCKHGTGLRSYPSGAMYSGQWKMGVRHGLGTMVWTNNDVYSGNWENGQMHGYGEYTWDTFFNNQLVVPQENCYYGSWENSVRHGNGTLETNLGVRIRGTWECGKKHGPAEVICNNGNFIYARNLFFEDCVSFEPEESMEADSLMDTTMHSAKLISVPVNVPNHEINLNFYIDRLYDYISNCTITGNTIKMIPSVDYLLTTPKFCIKLNNSKRTRVIPQIVDHKTDCENEEILLRNIILQYLSVLKVLYVKYSELWCHSKPTCPTVLMRIMLWQLLQDCNLHNRGLSLARFDILIANNKASLVQSVHYPFERLQFWQFLHTLLEISWELYGKKCEGTPFIRGILASALHKLIAEDILPNAGHHKGTVLFKFKNLMSLDSAYWYYRSLGEPLSARKLLNEMVYPKNELKEKIPNYPEHLLHGKNVIGVGGKLAYHPNAEPLLIKLKSPPEEDHPLDLSFLRELGVLAIFKIIQEVCPSIQSNGIIVNMDYKVVFLEFYEILLWCTRLCVQLRNAKIKAEEEERIRQINLQLNLETDAIDEAPETVKATTEAKKSLKGTAARKKSDTKKKNKKK